MSNAVRITCTALLGVNKAGSLTADENGYYDMILGGYDTTNHGGAYYATRNNDGEDIASVLKRSVSLQRQMNNGNLRGEYGHPKMEPGMSALDFRKRIMRVEETLVCAHMDDIRTEEGFKTRQGKTMTAVRALVKPSGPYGPTLEAQIKNGKENVCFSVRGLTSDVLVGGRLVKKTNMIVNWDYVNEPGIAGAEKYSSPSLESIHDEVISPEFLISLANEERMNRDLGIENNGPSAEEIAKAVGWGNLIQRNGKLPRSFGW